MIVWSAATESGTPIEWLSPIISETVGFVSDAIISASASPHETSPPTVFIRKSIPSISSSPSIDTSIGNRCSYLVVFTFSDALLCPSISPIIEITKKCFPLFSSSSSIVPYSLILSIFSSFLCCFYSYQQCFTKRYFVLNFPSIVNCFCLLHNKSMCSFFKKIRYKTQQIHKQQKIPLKHCAHKSRNI